MEDSNAVDDLSDRTNVPDSESDGDQSSDQDKENRDPLSRVSAAGCFGGARKKAISKKTKV